MELNKQRFILASSSPRRKQLLEMVGVNFRIIIPEVDEKVLENESALDFVKRVSIEKGSYVRDKYKIKDEIIISSDTIVLIEDKIIGKPKSKENAYQMLKQLSGNVHQVITGISLIINDNKYYENSITDVFFKELNEEEITYYLNNEDYMDKAGAYAIQGLASVFIKKINGCFFNVMGFPLNLFYEMVNKIKIK